MDYSGIKKGKYTNDDYPTYLARYRASIAATTFYPTLKYWENPAAGCLTFMEITERNDGKYIGFKDNESAIFINENNYKEKFEEFLNDPDNTRWEEIATAGIIEKLAALLAAVKFIACLLYTSDAADE